MKENKNIIITFLALAVFFVSMAFFTLNITYAYEPEQEVFWNIHMGDAIYKYDDKKYDVVTNNEYVNFKVTLVDYGDEYGVKIPIINNGNIDTYLKKVEQSLLNEEVGVGFTGRIYYIKDYVSYSIRYGEKSEENNIVAGAFLQEKDLLKAKTTNYIELNVKFADKERLSEEAIEVLDKSNFKVKKDNQVLNGFNLDLELKLNYQELK